MCTLSHTKPRHMFYLTAIHETRLRSINIVSIKYDPARSRGRSLNPSHGSDVWQQVSHSDASESHADIFYTKPLKKSFMSNTRIKVLVQRGEILT